MQTTTATPASKITVGQMIMPPARELRLWMRRDLAAKGLPESALLMTVTETYQGAQDKRGPWLVIVATESAAWAGDRDPSVWKIKVRPNTMWPVISAAVNS